MDTTPTCHARTHAPTHYAHTHPPPHTHTHTFPLSLSLSLTDRAIIHTPRRHCREVGNVSKCCCMYLQLSFFRSDTENALSLFFLCYGFGASASPRHSGPAVKGCVVIVLLHIHWYRNLVGAIALHMHVLACIYMYWLYFLVSCCVL